METKNYSVNGEYRQKSLWHKFEAHTSANSEKLAQEKVISNIGSRHKVQRHHVKIEKVTASKA